MWQVTIDPLHSFSGNSAGSAVMLDRDLRESGCPGTLTFVSLTISVPYGTTAGHLPA
jgi:hypothetical protein